MVYERRPDKLSYRGHNRTIETLGWWCIECGEGVLTGEVLLENERVFLELKRLVENMSIKE